MIIIIIIYYYKKPTTAITLPSTTFTTNCMPPRNWSLRKVVPVICSSDIQADVLREAGADEQWSHLLSIEELGEQKRHQQIGPCGGRLLYDDGLRAQQDMKDQ